MKHKDFRQTLMRPQSGVKSNSSMEGLGVLNLSNFQKLAGQVFTLFLSCFYLTMLGEKKTSYLDVEKLTGQVGKEKEQ